MDLVVLQADNSDGEELRYTLRSIEKNIDGIDKLYVIGKRPDWLMNGNCIPCPDPHPSWDKEKNMVEKILLACRITGISDRFLYCSDDVYTLTDRCPQTGRRFQADVFPVYYSGDLHDKIPKRASTDPYKNAMLNTISALLRTGKDTTNYDVHTPMVVDKNLFSEIMGRYGWNIKYGYVIKSLYQNNVASGMIYRSGKTFVPDANKELSLPVLLEDNKIYTPKTVAAIHRMIDSKPFFSTNEHSFNDEMRQVLHSLFPKPSRWEMSALCDPGVSKRIVLNKTQ